MPPQPLVRTIQTLSSRFGQKSATFLRDAEHARGEGFFFSDVPCGTDHVVRVLRPDGLGHNVLDCPTFRNTAASGPPAMIPVPSGAVRITTRRRP